MAVIVMLAILSIVLIYIGANYRWVYSLEREIRLTEQKQIRRLNALSSAHTAPAKSPGEVGATTLPAPDAARP
jgi:hypothetical protein